MKGRSEIRSGKYLWKDGVHLPVDAQVFGEWVMGLPDQQPDTIVAAARKRGSPAHSLFQWNDAAAAHEQRLIVARRLYGSLVVEAVVYKRDRPEVFQVKALVRGSREGPYEPVAEVMSNRSKRDYLLAQCLRELKAIRREYSTLSELAIVFAAIDEVAPVAKKRKRA